MDERKKRMNQRIQQLSEQAIEIVSNKRMLKDGQLERTWNPNAYDQVFAELIIKECAAIALREDHDPYECILAHFGIQSNVTQRRQPPLDSSYPDGNGY